jgi:hypothetical protein
MTRRPKHHEPDDQDGSPEDDQAGLPSLFEECFTDRWHNAIDTIRAAGVARGDHQVALAAMIVARLHAVRRTARVLIIGRARTERAQLMDAMAVTDPQGGAG